MWNSPLRTVRLVRGESLSTVARALDCSVAHLSNIENGHTKASPEFAERLVAHFGSGCINELQILYPLRESAQAPPKEELELLGYYRRMREGQKRVLTELAAVMAFSILSGSANVIRRVPSFCKGGTGWICVSGSHPVDI